jgi:hypothetical protein
MSKNAKLILAVVLLIVAGVLIAWNLGVFEGKQPPPPDTSAPPKANTNRGIAPGAKK